MGLFSSKTKVYVASSLWNLAGDQSQRPDLVPSLVLSSILTGSKEGIGAHISTNLRSATALRSKSFFRWARSHYTLGLPSGRVGGEVSVARTSLVPVLKAALGLGSDKRITVLSALLDEADVEYWAEHWVIRNRPALTDLDWSADFSPTSAEIVIEMPGETVRIPAHPDYLWGILRDGRKLLHVAYQVLTQNAQKLWTAGPVEHFTYRMGTGNVVLDAIKPAKTAVVEFFPAIPLRIGNDSVRDRDDFDHIKKAFKKLTGGKIEEVLDAIEEHESVGDMDHAFVVPGISLNTRDKAGQAYLYEFFQGLMAYQQDRFDGQDFLEDQLKMISSKVAYDRWMQANGSANGSYTNPFWDKVSEAAEEMLSARAPRHELDIVMKDLPEFDFRLWWADVSESQHLGNARYHGGGTGTKLKKGAYLIKTLPDVTLPLLPYYTDGDGSWNRSSQDGLERIGIFHQYEKNRYRMLTILRLEHANYVYKDKAVKITAKEALDDAEESGFLIPLHYPTLKRMSALRNAQLVSCSSYVVVNSYKKVKQKWWQRGIFKVILFVAAIVISVISAGAGLATIPGILGTNAAVGAMLGASAAMAAIVGAVANGIAAIVLTSLITKASTAILGEKLGQIIGTIIAFVSLQAGAAFASTGSMSFQWTALMRPDNIMKLTDSVAGAYNQWLAMDTANIYARMGEMGEEYNDQMRDIQERAQEILGMTNVAFDPMMLSDASEYFGEPSEAFLGRTLLTGSELVEMSHALVSSFAELSLDLPGAF